MFVTVVLSDVQQKNKLMSGDGLGSMKYTIQLISFIDHQSQFHVQLLQYIVCRCERVNPTATI